MNEKINGAGMGWEIKGSVTVFEQSEPCPQEVVRSKYPQEGVYHNYPGSTEPTDA